MNMGFVVVIMTFIVPFLSLTILVYAGESNEVLSNITKGECM